MIRLAFFNSSKSWGGGEKWHMEAALHFATLPGYQVFVFGTPDSELKKRLATHPQISYIDFAVSNRSFLNPIKINHLRSLFSKLTLDIVIINGSADMKIAAHAGRLAGIKRIIYRRGLPVALKNNIVNRLLFKYCITEVLTNSIETKKTINRKYAQMFPEQKIKVIYNPIDTSQFSSDRSPSSKPGDEIIIGNLGRLAPEKNQTFLIDLSQELSRRNIKHKVLIGGIGPLQKELEKYSKQCNTQENVHFLGFITDLDSFFRQIDIFLLSSKWEGFGYVLAEAALFHKPTIAFNVSSSKELIADGESGYLVPFNNVSATIDAILALNDPQKRVAFGNAGYNLVCEKFDSSVIYQQLEAFLS